MGKENPTRLRFWNRNIEEVLQLFRDAQELGNFLCLFTEACTSDGIFVDLVTKDVDDAFIARLEKDR